MKIRQVLLLLPFLLLGLAAGIQNHQRFESTMPAILSDGSDPAPPVHPKPPVPPQLTADGSDPAPPVHPKPPVPPGLSADGSDPAPPIRPKPPVPPGLSV
jgi:hypothetical protein